MSEIIAPPGDWELHPKKEASDLSNYLTANNHRLISIKSFVENGKRFFSAISVRNEDGLTWNWDYQITPKDLDNAVKVEDSRLISLLALSIGVNGRRDFFVEIIFLICYPARLCCFRA